MCYKMGGTNSKDTIMKKAKISVKGSEKNKDMQ